MLGLMCFSSVVLAQPAAPAIAPTAQAKPVHARAPVKAKDAKSARLTECLNNRPAEAEAYDCRYIARGEGRSAARLATVKAPPKAFAVAAIQ
jgi:hypothetical protein